MVMCISIVVCVSVVLGTLFPTPVPARDKLAGIRLVDITGTPGECYYGGYPGTHFQRVTLKCVVLQ